MTSVPELKNKSQNIANTAALVMARAHPLDHFIEVAIHYVAFSDADLSNVLEQSWTTSSPAI